MKKAEWFMSLVVLFVVCLFVSGIVFAEEEYNWKEVASWEVDDKGEFLEKGLQLHLTDFDGKYEVVQKSGVYAVETVPGEGWMFLYFTIDDDILYEPPNGTPIRMQVEYFDEGIGSFAMNQTSWVMEYHWSEVVQKKMSNKWKVYDFVLTDARFNNGGHDKYDFRVQAGEKKLAIRKIAIFVTE